MLSSHSVAFLALVTSVVALPTSSSTSGNLASRDYHECSAGYWYSKCGTWDGCYNYDPCSLPPQTVPSQTPPPPPPACKSGRVIAPQFTDLQVQHPDSPMTNTSGNLMALFREGEGKRNQDQVAMFTGIPRDAKSCRIGWRQKALPRTFGVEDNGRVAFQVIPRLPQPVTYNAVRGLVDVNASERTMDFTFWDQSPGAVEHDNGDVPCSENIYVYLTPANGVTGGVFMQGSSEVPAEEQQGVFIDYTC
jgi:hypothetical protein